MTDLRAALRNLSRYPMTSLVAILSLALGIGCATATLAIRDAVFFNPPPLYQSPSELSFVGVSTLQRPLRQGVSPSLYDLWARDGSVISTITASTSTVREVKTTGTADSATVRSITPSFLATLGVQPQAGRGFSGADAAAGNAAILSFAIWDRLFQQRDDAIGQSIWIDGDAYTVVGIMPKRFWYGEMQPSIWIPLDVQRYTAAESLDVVVRRKAGVTSAALSESLGRALSEYVQTLPDRERNLRVQVDPVQGTPIGWMIGPGIVWLLEGCVFLTLFISCTNV